MPDSERRDRHIRLMVRDEDYEDLARLAEERSERIGTTAYALVREALKHARTIRRRKKKSPRKG